MKRAVIASPRSGRLAQLVRAPALQAGGRGIEALTAHHLFSELRLDGLYNSAHTQRMKRQDGYLTKESGAWLGHYSRWITDYSTGQRKRQQRAFKIGPVSTLTKTRARDKLRERIVSELGITADSRVTLGWFTEQRWIPLHEGRWRDSTKAVNAELLKFVVDRFGKTPIEDMDPVQMSKWLAAHPAENRWRRILQSNSGQRDRYPEPPAPYI
jgi:hypothetical protein